MSRVPDRQARGAWAEDEAHRFLLGHGLSPIARNYRCPVGEIDLVMYDRGGLVFAEVRYRGRGAWVSGTESVDHRKRQRLVATAEHFLQRHREHVHRACRFDVVGVTGTHDAPAFDWIQDAFGA